MAKLDFNNNGEISGELHKVSKPRGLVILVHGFTGTIDGPSRTSWKKLARALTKENFDVYRFNFRFTGPDWKEFQKMTISGEVSDLKFLLKKLSKKYKKIALVGESLGGMISILAYNKRVNSLVLWYPTIDLQKTSLKNRFESPSAITELKEKGYVTIEKRSTKEPIKVGRIFVEERKRIKLYKDLRKISCPTLIVSPDTDTVVPFWQSERALKLINSKNKMLYKIKNSDHAWWKIPGKKRDWKAENLAIKETVKWINMWLK